MFTPPQGDWAAAHGCLVGHSGCPCSEVSVVVTLRVRSCELAALTAVLVEPEQQNQSDLVRGEEKT